MNTTPQQGGRSNGDAAKAVKFMALKAAIFILIPVIAAAVAVMVML